MKYLVQIDNEVREATEAEAALIEQQNAEKNTLLPTRAEK